MRLVPIFVYLFFLLGLLPIKSQICSNLNFDFEADIPSTCNKMVMTMLPDQLDRPFLYIANKEAGLVIYNISNLSSPTLSASVPITLYDSLDVMSLSQNGNYLYLAIGSHFNSSQKSGMAVVDVTNPSLPILTDFWSDSTITGGSGVVKTEGNYAYLGAMGNGLIILDITTKNDIKFVSQFVPDINYPVKNPTASLYNARGMEVKNSIVYLCYDAGGVRIINCENKSTPVETGRFCNEKMYKPQNLARAYNTIILNDTLAYVAVDYCGVEILNIKDTGNITLVGWWNPYNCPQNNWFSSPVHANELAYDKTCNILYTSTGKSDLVAVDVANPSQPDSCNFYGGSSNSIGTWGVALHKNQLYLSYICTFGIPFASNWTGVKIISHTPCSTVVALNETQPQKFKLFPSPTEDKLIIQSQEIFAYKDLNIILSTINGQTIDIQHTITNSNELILNTSKLNNGMYFITLTKNQISTTHKFIKK